MISAYGSSGSFGSRVRSKYIGYNTYTGIISHFCSKPSPIHGPVNKSDMNCSYLRSHFSKLPQAVAKNIINHFSQKFSYASKIIDPGIDGFRPNYEPIQIVDIEMINSAYGFKDHLDQD